MQASSLLTSHTTTCLRKGMEKLLRFIQEDFLNDTSKSPPGPGQTQNMQGLSSLLEKVDILLTAGGDAIEAEQMVRSHPSSLGFNSPFLLYNNVQMVQFS